MKNTKILISEISRINELMGVQLLSEQAFAKVADDVIDFFRKSGKSIDNVTFDLLDDLKKATSDYEIGRILTDIAKNSPEIGQKIVQTYTDILKKDPSSPFNTLKNNLLDGINNKGLTRDETTKLIDDYVNNFEFDGLRRALRKELDDFADDTFSKKTGATPPPKGNVKGGVPAQTLDAAAQKFSQGVLDSAGLTRTEKILLNRQWPIGVGLRKLFLEYSTKNIEKYVDAVYGNLKQMVDESGNANSLLNYQNKLTVQLDSLQKTIKGVDVEQFKDNIVKSLRDANVDSTTTRKIESYLSRADNKKFNEYFDFWKRFYETTPGLIFKDIKDKNFGNLGKRVGNLIAFGTVRLRKELGDLGGVGSKLQRGKNIYLYLMVATKVIMPVIIGTIWSLVQAAGAGFFGIGEDKGGLQRLIDNLTARLYEGIDDGWQDLIPFQTYIDNIYNGYDLASQGKLWDSRGAQEALEQRLEQTETLPTLPDATDIPQNQDDTTATEEQPVTEPSGTYGTTLDEFKRYLASTDGWGAEDYKTLTNVETRDINGITYYLAFDTDNVTYYYFYQDGKFKPNTN
jgi:hypothetical protein